MTHPTIITATPGQPFIELVREFNAPVEAVFRAHTEAQLYEKWLGPRDTGLHVVELDASPGGRWKYEFRGDGDMLMSFFGVFHTVEPDRLIIQTFEFSLAPGQVGVDTTTFEQVDGRTRLSIHEVYPSVEARDAAVASGMESGIIEGYERLDELLARGVSVPASPTSA